MLGTQRFLFDRQGALVKWLGLAIAALFPIERCQVVEVNGDTGMPGTQRFLFDRQGALVKWLGLAIAALGFIKQR